MKRQRANMRQDRLSALPAFPEHHGERAVARPSSRWAVALVFLVTLMLGLVIYECYTWLCWTVALILMACFTMSGVGLFMAGFVILILVACLTVADRDPGPERH
jgi:hypothetical protein